MAALFSQEITQLTDGAPLPWGFHNTWSYHTDPVDAAATTGRYLYDGCPSYKVMMDLNLKPEPAIEPTEPAPPPVDHVAWAIELKTEADWKTL